MEWEKKFSVGMLEIDNQHKELLRLLSEVEASIASNKGWSSTHYCILALQQFARFHFEFEEALMRLYGFPDYEQHAEEHRQLSVKAESIARKSLSVEENDKTVMQFMTTWLFNHIQSSDKGYARYILAGAKPVQLNDGE